MSEEPAGSSSESGRIPRSVLREQLERESRHPDGSPSDSILGILHKLKESIREKDRIITRRTAELTATRDYLTRVFTALSDAVLVIDPQGRVEFANPAALELLGYATHELLGQPAQRLWADPDHAAYFEGQGLEEQLRQQSARQAELVVKTKAGKAIPVSWASTVFTLEGEPAGLVGIARDIRVQRRLEEEKLVAIQALAASVAHEIRNPLGAIQNSVALLARDLPLSGDDADLMEIVLTESQRIGTIVSQFLDFARPVQPTFHATDLGQLLGEVVTLAEQDERVLGGRALLLHVEPELPELSCDADQIKQVVWNLVSNALDAAAERVAIRVRRATGGGAEVRVADDGPGMTPEALARAAEPFRTTKATGSGLGLAIVKRIVEAHGGVFTLESTQGEGTTASFKLPLVARA